MNTQPMTRDEVYSMAAQLYELSAWRTFTDTYNAMMPIKLQPWQLLEAFNAWQVPIEVLCRAVESAAIAPRPSWAYLRAIAARCRAQQIQTVEAYDAQQLLFSYEREQRKRKGISQE